MNTTTKPQPLRFRKVNVGLRHDGASRSYVISREGSGWTLRTYAQEHMTFSDGGKLVLLGDQLGSFTYTADTARDARGLAATIEANPGMAGWAVPSAYYDAL